MDTKEAILTEAFLLRASPETVYEWLKAWPQRTTEFRPFGGNDIPKDIELQLLSRKNEIVDLGLAAWGTQNEPLAILYQRWCARSVAVQWPPQPSTFPYAVLAAILANVNAAGVIFGRAHIDISWLTESDKNNSPSPDLSANSLNGMPSEDFDWVIEHGDDRLLSIMHSNIGPAIGLLKKCAARSDAYQRIDDRRWLTILAILGRNKRLQVPAKEYDDAPDLDHWDVHKAFIEAVTISPKTSEASDIFWGIFIDLPTTATEKAYVKDEVINAAVSAWNVEIASDDQHSFLRLSKSDALNPSERVQFHLLRHYCSWINLAADDPIRVRRLAAYAKNPVSGEHGLDISSFQKYSDRDGPAFVYATSLNSHIWRNKAASDAMVTGNFPEPEETDDIYRNRAVCIVDGDAESSSRGQNALVDDDSVASRALKAVEELKAELGGTHREMNATLRSLRTWILWGGIVLIGLLIFKY